MDSRKWRGEPRPGQRRVEHQSSRAGGIGIARCAPELVGRPAGPWGQRPGQRQPVDRVGAGDVERAGDLGSAEKFEDRRRETIDPDRATDLIGEERHGRVTNETNLGTAVSVE